MSAQCIFERAINPVKKRGKDGAKHLGSLIRKNTNTSHKIKILLKVDYRVKHKTVKFIRGKNTAFFNKRKKYSLYNLGLGRVLKYPKRNL